MASAAVGIDLGTTNSVVALSQGGRPRVLVGGDGNPLIPSVVSFHPNGQTMVGAPARARRPLDPSNTVFSVKRLMGRPFDSEEVRRAKSRFAFELRQGPDAAVLVNTRAGDLSLPEISALILREIRRIGEAALGESIERAVITVPANFNELQRTATKFAGQIADLDVIRILNEPTAAALAYGYGRGTRERIAIYDFGGGTFDVTLLELSGNVFEVLATAGDTFLGGDDIDTLLADNLADALLSAHRVDAKQDRRAYELLRGAAEQAKIDLSSMEMATIRIPEIGYGLGGRPLEFKTRITRADLERLAAPLIGRTVEVCNEALKLASMRPIECQTVILVGGSSRIPAVRSRVREFFGREPLTTLPPEQVVGMGAAILAEALSATRKPAAAPVAQTQARTQTLQPGPATPRSPIPAPGAKVPAVTIPNVAPASFAQTMLTTDDPVAPASTPSIFSKRIHTNPGVPPAPPTGELPAPGTFARRNTNPGFAPNARPIDALDDPALSTTTRSPSLTMPALDPSMLDEMQTDAFPKPPNDLPHERDEPTNRYAAQTVDVRTPSPPAGVSPAAAFTPARARVGVHPGTRTHVMAAAVPPPEPPPPSLPPPPEPMAAFAQTAIAPPSPPLRPPPPAPPPAPAQAVSRPNPAPAAYAPTVVSPAVAPHQGPRLTESSLGFPSPVASTGANPMGPSVRSPGFSFPPVAGAQSGAPALPLLLDVTPHSLGIETVGGLCEAVIPRNATIPVEQTREFATAYDGQDTVRLRIAQGESRRFGENYPLGELELSGITPAARGDVTIAVTFELDADGTLNVRAKETATGRETQTRVVLLTMPTAAEAANMAQKQRVNG